SPGGVNRRMNYTRQFRQLREAKNLSREQLAALAGCHRNTVINIETGRPVKFSTVSELLKKMGYAGDSAEMKGMALLWLEAVSGLKFSAADAQKTGEQLRAVYRRSIRSSQDELLAVIMEQQLSREQIELLVFAARHPDVLEILRAVRDFSESSALASDPPGQELKAAEE